MTKDDLQDKVYRVSIESYTSLEDVNDPKNSERYVQIKRQKFKSDTKDYDMLKIVDVSMDVLYERSQGEKKLLTVINATVSHEMRNPINSINTLNIKQQETNEKLRLLIERLDIDVPPLQFKSELIAIHNESAETSKVQKSSSKILCFLVNDILDYAQLKQGKFRRDCT